MTAAPRSRHTPGRGTAAGGLRGAAAGLAVAALWTGAGTWVTQRSSGVEGPAILGVVLFLTGLACMVSVGVLGLPLPYVIAVGVLTTLMVLPLAYYDDAVLNRRGERVTAVVVDTKAQVSQPSGSTSQVCRVRLPDRTEADVAGPGCHDDTRAGDRLTVHQDPKGQVPPKLEARMTAGQLKWLAGTCVAALVALGARIGVHLGQGRHRTPR